MGNIFKILAYLIAFYLRLVVVQCALKVYPDRLMAECPDFKNSVIKHSNVKIQYTVNRELNVTYTMKISRRITERLRVEAEITRCQSREAPDTCVVFLNLRTTKACKMLESTNQFYSPLVAGCLTPKPKCPFEKGIYRGKNCTLNMAVYNMYPLIYGYYWKVKHFFVNDKTNQIINCNVAEFMVRREN